MANTNKYVKNLSPHTKKQKKLQLPPFRNPALIPLILVLGILPIITKLNFIETNLVSYPWYGMEEKKSDVFLYSKANFFIIMCGIMCVILLYKLLTQGKKITFSKVFLPLFLYGILALLSTIFSKYSFFGYHGIIEQFETVWVLMGYSLIAYYSFMIIKDESDINYLMIALFISCLIGCLIGLSQFLGYDFFTTQLGKVMIVPQKYADVRERLEFNFSNSQFNSVYMSLYNPNYVGSYMALLSPIFFALLFSSKNIKLILTYGILFVLLILCGFGSGSKTGLIALVFSGLFLLFFFRRELIKHWKISVSLIVIFIGLFFAYSFISGANIITYVKNALTVTKQTHPLQSIEVKEDHIEILYNNNLLTIRSSLSEEGLVSFDLTDQNEQVIETSYEEESALLHLTDERFPNFSIQVFQDSNYYLYGVTIDGYPWLFTNFTGDGLYHYISPTGKEAELRPTENFLEGYDSFASGRGYIWGKTIPLLKKNILLGTGADTFTLAFPHDDYVSHTNAGYRGMIITKPHNMYLQIGVQTGVLSLLCILVFYGIYFVSSCRLYSKLHLNNFLTCTGAGIFIGTIGYMLSGIANDSTITIAPIFWALIGIGFAINRMLKKSLLSDSEKEKALS